MFCLLKCVRREYFSYIGERNDIEIWGKGYKEFEEFRKTLIICEGGRIGEFDIKGVVRIFERKVV